MFDGLRVPVVEDELRVGILVEVVVDGDRIDFPVGVLDDIRDGRGILVLFVGVD